MLKFKGRIIIVIVAVLVVVGLGAVYAWNSTGLKEEYGSGKQVGPCRSELSCDVAVKDVIPKFQKIVDYLQKRVDPRTGETRYVEMTPGDATWNDYQQQMADVDSIQLDLESKGWGTDLRNPDNHISVFKDKVIYNWRIKLVYHDVNKCPFYDTLSLNYYPDGQPETNQSDNKLKRMNNTKWYYGVYSGSSRSCIDS